MEIVITMRLDPQTQQLLQSMSNRLDQVLSVLSAIQSKEMQMATTLDDVLADVTAEKGLEDSVITLLQGIKKQLDDLLAGGLSPEQQAKVDAIFTQVETNKAALSAAITANS